MVVMASGYPCGVTASGIERVEAAPFAVEIDRRGVVIVTALPAAVDLRLYRGDDFTMTLTVTGPSGAPADLSDATARAQVRAAPNDPDEAGEFECEITGNVVALHLTSAVSAGLPLRAAWDCQLTRSGMVTTLAAGSVTLTPDVTRP